MAERSTRSNCSRERPNSGQRQDVLERRRHLFDGRDHPLAIFLGLDGFGADAQRGERRSEVVADGAQSPVLFFEQIDDAAVHGVERLDCVEQVGRTARFHRHRLIATAERLGGPRQIAQRTCQPQRDEDRGGEDEQVEKQRCQRELGRDERRLPGNAEACVEPAPVRQLDREKHRLRRTPASVGPLLRRVRIDGRANVVRGDPGGLERLLKPILGVVAAVHAVRYGCLCSKLVMRATARCVAEDNRFEFGRRLDEVLGGRGEAGHGRCVDLGAVELLPLRKDEGEAR